MSRVAARQSGLRLACGTNRGKEVISVRKATFMRVLVLLASIGAAVSSGDLVWPK